MPGMRHYAVELERLDVDQPVVGQEYSAAGSSRMSPSRLTAGPAAAAAGTNAAAANNRLLLNPESAMNASAQLKGLS